MKSFINWLGGKSALRETIVSIMPPHKIYCEVFGGAAWVLFHKQPSKIEVYNDIASELVNLFKQVKYHHKALFHELSYYFRSRQLFYELRDHKPITELQRAARFYFLLKTSFGGKMTGFATTRSTSPSGIQRDFRAFAERLKDVIIENLDFEKCIKLYDTEDTLFFCDPPYFHGESYKHINVEFNYDDHVRLRDTLKNVKGKWILTIDDCPEARGLYSEFYMMPVQRKHSMNKRVPEEKRSIFKELIITNFPVQRQLFHGSEEVINPKKR